MELFHIERYTEVDSTKLSEKSIKTEDAILNNLLKKAAKRKRKRDERQEGNAKPSNEDENNYKTTEETIKDDNAIQMTNATEQMDDLLECADDSLTKDMDTVQNENKIENVNYQILGQDIKKVKNPIVNMTLPHWLAHPEIISSCISESNQIVDDVPYLSDHIKNTLKKMNIIKLFPVQSAIIPNIIKSHYLPPPLRPRDLCVSVPTGSGKTLAFVIPIVQLLSEQWTAVRKVRALIILPVGELALQVFKVFKQLCKNTTLNVCLLSTQSTLRAEQDKLVELYREKFYSKVDIIVTTPGRLVDHLHSTKGLCLKSLKFLVVDEADRIMDATFQNWLKHLDDHIKANESPEHLGFFREPPLCLGALEMTYRMQPHKMLFSATLSPDPENLHNLGLFQPQHFTSSSVNLNELLEKYTKTIQMKVDKQNGTDFIEHYITPAELDEKYCLTESRLKPLTLFALIKANHWTKFLCFTNSVNVSGRLTFVLKQLFQDTNDNVKIAELSGSLKAKERSNILNLFEQGKINGVICSDALARGIDIPNVDVIISYDPPRHIKTYIHRVGRTARAGRKGTAITILNEKELETFNNMLTEVSRLLPAELTASTDIELLHANQYKSALTALRHKILKDTRLRLLKKEHLKEQQQEAAAITSTKQQTKNTSDMTLTEKLQLQATKQIHKMNIADEKDPMLNSKKNRMKKYKIKKKKNTSKSKTT